MKKILKDGEVLAFTDSPRYIRVNSETGVFVEADITNATGVAVNSNAYHLSGHGATYGNGDVAIEDVDSVTELTKMYENIKATQDNSDNLASVDETIVDYELRIAILETYVNEDTTTEETA